MVSPLNLYLVKAITQGYKKESGEAPDHYYLGFILDEAEVDDEIEEEDDWEEGATDDIIERSKNNDYASARELNSHRSFARMIDFEKEDEIEEYYKRKYADQAAAEGAYYDEGELPDDITQQALMPGVKDPNLWQVKCKIGEEKQTVLQLMRKYIAYRSTSDPLLIKSVISPEGVKGYIYIEAFKQTHVKQAIEGIGNLKIGKWKQMMVPIVEMTDVLKVKKEQAQIKIGQWARLKRGLYKDDIAQVDYVDQAQGQVHLKLVPRIDYKRKRGALRSESDTLKRKKTTRPAAKLFDVDAIKQIGGEVTTDGDFQVFESNRYRRGFLYKSFSIGAVQTEGVIPTLSEIDKFEENPVGIEISECTINDEKAHSFSPGDNVEVIEGDLIHLQGKIISIDGPKITMMPKHEDLKDPLDFQAHELKKYFKVGDHVKVIAGRFENDTGLIVRVEDNYIVLFSDLTMHEITVLAKDLQLCVDMATGVDSLGQFQWGDLIQLDNQTVGVIVRLEKEHFQVLNMKGQLVTVKPQSVVKKREDKRAVALDSDQSQIQVKDHVICEGQKHSGIQGEIRHLFRGYAFLYSRMVLENGGIFVCKTSDLKLSGSKRASNSYNSIGSASPAPFMSPRITSPRHPSSGGGSMGGGQNRGSFGIEKGGRNKSDFQLIGKTIRINQGTYKGYIGIVKDSIGSTARVELHSSCQTITVDKSRICVVDANGLVTNTSSNYNKTPMYGSKTPISGSRTPSYGSQTPNPGASTRDVGSSTPYHDPSRTPSHTGSSWDPSSSDFATPNTNFGDDWDEPTTGPSSSGYLNPPTPGYGGPDTPSNGPYTPQTPALYGSSEVYSPFPTQPSPVSNMGYPGVGATVPSPSGSTMTGNYMSPSSVGYGPGISPSPNTYNFSPMTPGAAPSPMFNPLTPGAGMENLNSVEWQTSDIEVRIRYTHDDEDLVNQTGIIRGTSGGMSSVFLLKEDRVVNIVSEHLEPVQPRSGDRVKVIFGEDRECTGELLSIDNGEGVVKMDGKEGDIRLLHLRYLCKMKS
ncbi:hypothetical protein RND71_043422 [Anisodus tanguticus]|uniref:Transcription elongation factor SPT5 n=1 Tax=Anisodus tanguticus TaxID=243964 RepID=A0AAE1QRK1_9SOLA|nr:hypothetical protein RND71_043422 [Anisodus tanguticus]